LLAQASAQSPLFSPGTSWNISLHKNHRSPDWGTIRGSRDTNGLRKI
jgi:hypothetical protein